jgi:CO/xanthine dehydrogenase Mo-binding subunit
MGVVVAHDCGLIVNPNGMRNQTEGNVIQSRSWALKEEARFDQRRITSVHWQTYPILTSSEIPESDIVVITTAQTSQCLVRRRSVRLRATLLERQE